MSNQTGLTLRERIAQRHEADARKLETEIHDLETQLLEIHDLPRIAQVLRADERQRIEDRLVALRLDRDRRRQQRAAAAA